MTSEDEFDLDKVFEAARAKELPASETFLDRVMLDADAVLAARTPPSATAPAPTIGAMIRDILGGWPAFGGLAAATVAGLWIGVAPPDALSGYAPGLWGDTYEVPLLGADILAGLEG